MAEPRDDLTDLAAELRALAGWLDTPEPPDVRAAVRARLATAPQATVRVKHRLLPWPSRARWVAAAVAAVLALVVAVLPPGRAAVAHAVTGLLRFAGVEVHRGRPPSLPATPGPLPSARSAALDEARRSARFPIRVPDRLGPPEQVLVADPAADGAPRVVSLLYRGGTVRLDAFDGTLDLGFLKTSSGPDTQWVEVGGDTALWFPAPHAVAYIDRQGVRRQETARLAAPTLIWASGTVSYRLEGVRDLGEALATASSLR